jgi:hypothetical protein
MASVKWEVINEDVSMDFAKLNLNRYQRIAVSGLPGDTILPFNPSQAEFDCLLAFVQSERQVEDAIAKVNRTKGKVGLILVYPKGTSKKHTSQVNRDDIVSKIKQDKRFAAPRLVSLDDDWSGFSFTFDSAS